VRAAVAEAHVTAEARKVLGAEGINFDLLSGDRALHCNRSDTTILVKHIAAGVTLPQLTALFAACGTLDAVAAPSDLSIALVRFADAAKAQVAFQRLAYKKLRNSPIFLEWAPIGSFNDDDEEPSADDGFGGLQHGKNKKRTADEEAAAAAAAELNSNAPRTVHTVYITNLPFGVTEASFREFLADSVPKIAARPELVAKLSLMASKGRAYVTVADAATEAMIISKLDGKNFQGRTLSAQMSKSDDSGAGVVATLPAAAAGSSGAAAAASSSSSSGGGASAGANACPPGRDPLKLIVKNLPFEATEADLRKLFAAFSEVKSVRVPKRVQRHNAHHTNNHRGFGFVEFLTADEAVRAKAALGATHLYGRHLVLDFAEKAGLDFTTTAALNNNE
jgi:multiple RNA-binding domain-containing protein 1